MPKSIVAVIFFIFLIPIFASAQVNKNLSAYDSVRINYVKEFPDKFYIKPILTVRRLSLELAAKDRQVDKISFVPSSNNFLGLGLYIFNINIELSFKVPQNEEEVPTEIYGQTESFDFQANIYAKKWSADVSYQNYQGFYVENPESHYPQWNEDGPFPIRDDLHLKYVQLNAFYLFNHKRFSFRAPYIQAEQQLKSQGSFLLGGFFSNFNMVADTALIPQASREFFPENSGFKKSRVTTLAVLPGYTYTLTYRDFYINAMLAAGPGNIWMIYDREGSEDREVKIRPVVGFRAAVGYNGDRFFTGITAMNNFVSANVGNLDVNSSSANIKLFFGVRFQEKGFMKKSIF